MINLPQNKRWLQANNSDLFGNISVTKNISFDNEGYLKLSNSSRAAMHSTIDADFDVPASMIYNEAYDFFIQTWDKCFSANDSILSAYPTQITDTDVPTGDPEGDVTWSDGKMIVTEDNGARYFTPGGTGWTDTNITLTDAGQHPVVNFLSLSALAIADVNTVKLYLSPITATPNLITTLTINADFEITGMAYLNQNLYIGTRNKYGGKAFMYVWNGSGSAAQQAYEVDSQIIFSLCVHKGSIVLLTGQGELLRFNGGGFTQLDAFPIFYTDRVLTDYNNVTLYKNIMKSNGDVLYILFTNYENTTNKLLDQPDGVWCYDEKVGLYHKYSLSNSLVNHQAINTTAVDITTNQITVASPAYPTGTEVYYRNDSTLIGGLSDDTKYFVIKVDATHIKLAITKANALAGTAIDLTSTGNITQELTFFPNIDFGATLCSLTMSLCVIDRPATNAQYGTDLLWGGEVELRALTGDNGFMGTVSEAVEARGYFITPKIFSDDVTDVFSLFTLKYSPFTSELDKIIIKYRTVDDMRKYINTSNWRATWTSTTTFTTTQADMADAVAGDEIEILRGAAGGLLAHITEIVNNSGTYTVTIDETFDQYLTGDVSTFVFRNWTKFAEIDSTNTLGYLNEKLDAKGKFIQFKVELRGLGVQIEEMKVDNNYLLPAKN